ncbi:MAG: adenosylcobinamide-GDP ribazoletransferase [Solirubrobacteraceae bacterium]|nr:adenosylcobinamide-GDP ribazoletransferase [Solirubrobacteraceae bacterium]
MPDTSASGASGARSDTSSRGAVALRAPLAALTLLTIVPVPARAQRQIGSREVAASAPFFPVVGAVLGLAIGVAAALVADRSGAVLGAAVATVLLAICTGALHLDGLADSADALGARGGARERRLAIMRDSSTGAYGTAAIAGWFVLTAAAMAALPAEQLVGLLVWALALARGLAVAHARLLPPARADGLGAAFSMQTASLAAALSVLLVIGVALAALPQAGGLVAAPPARVLVASAAAGLAAFAVVWLAARRLIGGRTGDTLGACVALVEAAVLVGAALAAG